MDQLMLNKIQENSLDIINPISQKDVVKLKHAFRLNINKQIRKIVTKNMSESHIQALCKYIIVQTMNREKPTIKDIQKVSELNEDMLRGITEVSAAPLFDASDRKKIKEAAKKRYKNHNHGLLGGYRRAYFPLIASNDKSETAERVEEYLNEKGYFVRDYKEGYATDIEGKQSYKIGKLIKENDNLSKEFMADDTRVSGNQYLVLSDYANDISHMSTRRGWESCMSYDGLNKDMISADVEKGTIIGYLINKNDPNIYNPLARVLFKPLYNANGDVRYHVNKCYGLHHDAFKKTAERIAEQISDDTNGIFKLPNMVYDDGAPFEAVHISEDTDSEEFLKILEVDYKKSETGQITVTGNLNISNLGLKKLPDLTKIKIIGSFDCSHNALMSLVGSPQEVDGMFRCAMNKITSLEGGPQIVKEAFDCRDNQLVTLQGAPKEFEGRWFDCSYNELTSLAGLPEGATKLLSDWGIFEGYKDIPKRYFKESKSRQFTTKIKHKLFG